MENEATNADLIREDWQTILDKLAFRLDAETKTAKADANRQIADLCACIEALGGIPPTPDGQTFWVSQDTGDTHQECIVVRVGGSPVAGPAGRWVTRCDRAVAHALTATSPPTPYAHALRDLGITPQPGECLEVTVSTKVVGRIPEKPDTAAMVAQLKTAALVVQLKTAAEALERNGTLSRQDFPATVFREAADALEAKDNE
jgi:hypothetical protein